jgi:hypothetical protein
MPATIIYLFHEAQPAPFSKWNQNDQTHWLLFGSMPRQSFGLVEYQYPTKKRQDRKELKKKI